MKPKYTYKLFLTNINCVCLLLNVDVNFVQVILYYIQLVTAGTSYLYNKPCKSISTVNGIVQLVHQRVGYFIYALLYMICIYEFIEV